MGIEVELCFSPTPGLDLSITGSILEAKFDSDVTTTAGAVIAGIRDGNRLPTVPELPDLGQRELQFPGRERTPKAYVGASFQHVGSRYTQPSDQENNPRSFVSGHALQRRHRRIGARGRPAALRCRPTITSTSAPGSTGTTAWA